ncbi:MAG TPA: phospholipase D-like domain-containing protein, partial [Burkholderiales bacterium]|nr:phospholipase D-like domain-containing protein [Burkholderiales bacterium]
MTKKPRRSEKTQHLKAFGRTLPITGILAKRIDLLGIPIPVAGIAIVVGLALIGVTIWGIVFSRAPAHITQHIDHRYAVADGEFLRSMGVLLGPPLLPGNKVDTLINGDQIFTAMLEAIRSAKKTITFESYIYWKGEVGKQFADALAERARSGVKVHVLLDWEGSHKMDQDSINEMGRAGVEIMKYHRPQWFRYRHLNHRTHRKLLVIDGRIGFTGGVGIADEWRGNAQDKDHWRDTHYRIEGPTVAQIQGAFSDNWTQATGAVLHGNDYFPPLEPKGSLPAQMFKSSVEGGAESIQLMYLLSIAAAQHTIDLSMAYFIPDSHTMDHIVAALKRGVRVRIITPGKETDSWLVRRASRAHWGRILEQGGEVYEYQPTMFHCKVLVIDGLWTSVGSTNFDSRSFRLNDEANLNIYDVSFAQRQIAQFENDLKRAQRITYEGWRSRP